jgi:hypothetical protein
VTAVVFLQIHGSAALAERRYRGFAEVSGFQVNNIHTISKTRQMS